MGRLTENMAGARSVPQPCPGETAAWFLLSRRSPLSPCPQASPPSASHAESPSQALLAHIRLRRLPLLTLHRPDQRTTGKQRSRMGRTPLAHSHTSCHSDSCPTKPRAGWLQGLEKVGASPFRGWKLGDRARLTGSCLSTRHGPSSHPRLPSPKRRGSPLILAWPDGAHRPVPSRSSLPSLPGHIQERQATFLGQGGSAPCPLPPPSFCPLD